MLVQGSPGEVPWNWKAVDGEPFGTSVDDLYQRPAEGRGPSDRLLAGEDRALVARAFGELAPRWRAVLWLTEVERLAPADAALLLRTSPTAAARLATRARSRLREEYLQIYAREHAGDDCTETTARLASLVAGELTPAQANRARGHLAECAGCRGRLSEIEDLKPSPRRGGARGAVAQLGRWPAGPRVAATVAAVLLVLGVGTAVTRQGDTAGPVRAAGPPAVDVARQQGQGQGQGLGLAPGPLGSTDGAPPEATSTTATTLAAPPAAPAAPFSPAGRLAAGQRSTVAQAVGSQVAVFDAPGAVTARRALANPRASGAPLVLLVLDQQPGWLHVLLPVRPNGSTGWIRSDGVSTYTHDFKIVVELGAHRITAYQGTDVVLSEPIGVGTAEAPTPGGLYYVTELFQPSDGPGGPYGPYAYGLSGYSEVLYDFGGGDGQFGIHGTNDPAGLGHDVSHGCIRMSNAGITRLARMLPLGVPVEIVG